MKKRLNINNRGWVAGFIVRFLSDNIELAEDIFMEVFPGKHLARNPQKGRKNKVKAPCVETADDKGASNE